MDYLKSEHLKFKRTISNKLIFIVPLITAIFAWIMGGYMGYQYMTLYRKYRNYPCVCLANPFVSVLSTQNGNVCADCVKYNTWDCPIYCYRIRKYNSMVVCTVLLGSKTGRTTYGN